MSWNAPQTITEALSSVNAGFSFQSSTGCKGEPIWVLTEITQDFYKATADEFGQDLVRRNLIIKDRYLKEHTREGKPEDLVYVVGRDGVLLVGLLRNGDILKNHRTDLPKRFRTFRDAAAVELAKHVIVRGHLVRTDT